MSYTFLHRNGQHPFYTWACFHPTQPPIHGFHGKLDIAKRRATTQLHNLTTSTRSWQWVAGIYNSVGHLIAIRHNTGCGVWKPVPQSPDLSCDHTNERIESAYAEETSKTSEEDGTTEAARTAHGGDGETNPPAIEGPEIAST